MVRQQRGISMKLFNFRIPDKLEAAIKERAAQEGVSASQVARSILEASLAKTKALTTAK
jgi:predicted HicB family RNase H-like nuclease